MSNTQKNIPELRFQGFESDWRVNIFSDFVTNKTSKFRPQENKSVIDIELDSIESNTGRLLNKYNSAEFSSQKNVFSSNQVLYSKLRPYLNKFYFPKFNGVCSSEIWVLNSKDKSILLNEFIYYFIQTSKFSNVANKSSGSKMPRADWELVKNIRLNLPSTKEQQKIGEFFSKLDHQIELEEKKLELLEQQKKGYMQKIFSQEIRFKDENRNDYPDWKEQKLEELGRFNSGVGFPEKYQGGNLGTPFFKVSDMNLPANKTFMNMANNYVTDQQINEKKWKVINDVPAVIFAKVGAAIMLNRKRMVIEPFLMDNNTMSYSFSNHWDTNFGNIFFQTLNLPKYAQVGALPSYNSKDIGTISVNLPSLSEQQKIGDFFSKLDNFIEKQSNKIELLKERKRGFLQKMFI